MKLTTQHEQPTRAGRWLLPLIGLAAVTGLILGLGLGRAHAAPTAPTQPEEIAGTALQYQRIAGTAFVPFTSSLDFSYPGAGCIQKSGGTETRIAHKAPLPEGSIVKYVRMYYFDNSPSQVTAFLTTCDAEGSFTELTSFGSTDDGG